MNALSTENLTGLARETEFHETSQSVPFKFSVTLHLWLSSLKKFIELIILILWRDWSKPLLGQNFWLASLGMRAVSTPNVSENVRNCIAFMNRVVYRPMFSALWQKVSVNRFSMSDFDRSLTNHCCFSGMLDLRHLLVWPFTTNVAYSLKRCDKIWKNSMSTSNVNQLETTSYGR